MKFKKIALSIFLVLLMIILNSTTAYALMAPISRSVLIIAGIMNLLSILSIIAYVIFVIVYSIKSKKDKKTKIKTIVILLIITILVVTALHFGSIAVLRRRYL